jgi:hypothetical protein
MLRLHGGCGLQEQPSQYVRHHVVLPQQRQGCCAVRNIHLSSVSLSSVFSLLLFRFFFSVMTHFPSSFFSFARASSLRRGKVHGQVGRIALAKHA